MGPSAGWVLEEVIQQAALAEGPGAILGERLLVRAEIQPEAPASPGSRVWC